VLGRCGLAATAASIPAGLDLIFGPNWAGIVARVLQRAAAGNGRVQLVTGNLARLEQLVEDGGWAEIEAAVAAAAGNVEGSFGKNWVATAASIAAADGGEGQAQAAAAGVSGGETYGLERQREGPAVRPVRIPMVAEGGIAGLGKGPPDDGPHACGSNHDLLDATSSASCSGNLGKGKQERHKKCEAMVESFASAAESVPRRLSSGRSTDAEVEVRGELRQETGVVSANASLPVRGTGAVERQQSEGPQWSSVGGAAAMAAVTTAVPTWSTVIRRSPKADARIALTGEGQFPAAAAAPPPPPSSSSSEEEQEGEEEENADGQCLGASSSATGSEGAPTAA
ncbi:hypothetical protein Vafri_2116, partial [Volvox africanus]